MNMNANAMREEVFIIFIIIMIVKYIFDCFTNCPYDDGWDFEDAVKHLFTRAIIVCIVYFVFM